MDLGLDGKAAIVTGGSRGIGRATALGLAAEGCGVAICGRGSENIDRALADLRQVSNRAGRLAALTPWYATSVGSVGAKPSTRPTRTGWPPWT